MPDAELRTFRPGDPEPDESVQQVKSAVVVWERTSDGWQSSHDRSVRYTWPVLLGGFPKVTEVRATIVPEAVANSMTYDGRNGDEILVWAGAVSVEDDMFGATLKVVWTDQELTVPRGYSLRCLLDGSWESFRRPADV